MTIAFRNSPSDTNARNFIKILLNNCRQAENVWKLPAALKDIFLLNRGINLIFSSSISRLRNQQWKLLVRLYRLDVLWNCLEVFWNYLATFIVAITKMEFRGMASMINTKKCLNTETNYPKRSLEYTINRCWTTNVVSMQWI